MGYYLEAFQKYAEFSGRSTRTEYWVFVLINAIIAFILWFIAKGAPLFGIVYVLYALGVLIPSLAVFVRRLHDTSRSAWWILLALIPIVGPIVLIVWLATDSVPGANTYGPNPKAVTAPSMP